MFHLSIVDEAQDTDEYQWGCVKKIAKHSQLLCLADNAKATATALKMLID